MNVQELIDALNEVEDKTLTVFTEGCDCDGSTGRVEVTDQDVYIMRGEYKPVPTPFPSRSWKERFSSEDLEKLP